MSSHLPSRPNGGRFQKGHSGNRKGRPVRSRSPQDPVLEVLVNPTVTVTGPDGARELSWEELLHWKMFQAALAGKAMAIRQVAKWITEYWEWVAKHAPKPMPRPITQLISADPENADEALQLLGIALPNPDRADIGLTRAQLLLEPWAVQAALRRRRGGSQLTDRQRLDVQRQTRDSDSLRWPRED
jgi:hypothetical protein